MKDRTSDSITVSIEGNEEKYIILKVIEFSSDRKRMSVVAKRESDSQVFSFVKGADSIILDRLSAAHRDVSGSTIEHLNMLAQDGLRTLMFAMKELPSDDVENISEESLENEL